MSTQTDFYSEFRARETSAAVALRASLATERDGALDAAKRDAAEIRDRERERLRAQLAAVDAEHDRVIGSCAAMAEKTRRERAARILERVFAADSFPSLVATWRKEPSRTATRAIQKSWREFDTIVRTELGDEIGVHIMTAAFVDALAVEFPEVKVSTRLANIDDGAGVDSRVIESLGMWTNALDAGPASAALEGLEAGLLNAARWTSSEVFGPQHAERVALRRKHATRRDYYFAVAAFNEQERTRAQAQFEKSFKPPPPPRLHRAPFGDGHITALEPARGN